MTKDGAVTARGVLSRGLLDHSCASSNREASQHLLSHDLYGVPCCNITLVSSSLFHSRYVLGVTMHSHRAETESWKGLRVNQDSNKLLHGPIFTDSESGASPHLPATNERASWLKYTDFWRCGRGRAHHVCLTAASLALDSFSRFYVHTSREALYSSSEALLSSLLPFHRMV